MYLSREMNKNCILQHDFVVSLRSVDFLGEPYLVIAIKLNCTSVEAGTLDDGNAHRDEGENLQIRVFMVDLVV